MIANYVVDFVLDPNCDQQRQDLCKQILEQKPDHVFLNIAWDPCGFDPCMLSVDEFLFKHGIPATWIILNWSEKNPLWQQNLKCNTIFIDFVLWRMYNEIIVRKTNKINPKWNPDADRYLFLTGKPDKIQRIGLLYQLYAQQLLDNCDHSFFMSPGMYNNSRRILSNLTTQEFDDFVQRHQRNLDNIEPDMQEHSMHYGGIPYNPDIYANSKFRLVSETSMHLQPPFITEKTYLTIVNKNPFVIAGDINSCQYLRSMGIEPFDQLFEIPTYDNIKFPGQRIQQVIAHVKQWLAGNFNKTTVADMVEHNFNRFVELGSKIKEDFEFTTGVDIDLAIYSKDSNHVARSKGW
jgi:hypothetical protein